MKLLTSALLAATALAAGIAAETAPRASEDIALRIMHVDEAGGFVAALVSPAPHILMQHLGGEMPEIGARISCEMLQEEQQLSCTLPDGKVIDLLPRGFMITSAPTDLRVGRDNQAVERSY